MGRMVDPSMVRGVLDPEQRVGPPIVHPAPLVLDGRSITPVGTARIYACGVTPYDVTHLGHAATFVWADVLAATLRSTGVAIDMCRNVTDVDDVLTAAARERHRHFDAFALTQEAVFEQSMQALRVAPPTSQPHARHHVLAVQQLADALLRAGAAYERDGAVWFRGARIPERAGLEPATARELSRAYGDDPDDTAKDDPFDVAVWRPSSAEHPAWPSPWGWGRPGWHAECAAMALTAHGASVDVLVGGEDLRFPHHAYQIAMAEQATGVRPFDRATMHVGEVCLSGAKMAKSSGNLVLVDDLLASWSPAVLRTLLIDRDHASRWDYDPAGLDAAQDRLDRLYAAAGRGGTSDDALAEATGALLDGLDVPRALDVAEEAGGEMARRVLSLLRLA